MKKIYLVSFVFIAFALGSCKKDYLETKPSNGVTEAEIFSSLTSIYAALDGVEKRTICVRYRSEFRT